MADHGGTNNYDSCREMNMLGPRIDRWIEAITEEHALVFAKRLAGNDTLLTNAHQAGPYLPRAFLFQALPELERPKDENPRVALAVRVESHGEQRNVNAIWYNGKLSGGTRNETRLTGFGGAQSPLLEPENTGALVLFAFTRNADRVACSIWLCETLEEEERVEAYLGTVDPGRGVVWDLSSGSIAQRLRRDTQACRLSQAQLPDAWLAGFPSGAEIIQKTLELLPGARLSPDERLLRRRDCEYEVFLSVEEALVLPLVESGFDTVGAFVDQAQTVLQRRKSRSGRSLELQVKAVLSEEGFKEGRDFQYNVESDRGKRPDFLFPSQAAYRNPVFPSRKLTMLGTKTTCRDRWRQVCNEADRIPTKHLLTLQEGVTQQQHAEMVASGVQLVVPKSLRKRYPPEIRPDLLTLSDFLALLERRRKSSG